MNADVPSGLFDDVTIVEFGQYIAAPYAAELFAHGGAKVISVEPVDGGPTRHNSPLGPPRRRPPIRHQGPGQTGHPLLAVDRGGPDHHSPTGPPG